MNFLKKTLIAGVIAAILVGLIGLILKFLWNIIAPLKSLSILILGRYIPGTELILLFIFILLIGLALNFWEKRKGSLGKAINRIPVIGRILHLFGAIKTTVSFFFGQKDAEGKIKGKNKIWVLIKWAPGVYSLGITSQTSIKKINEAAGQDLIAVLPTSVPFPGTAVSLLFLPPSKIIPLDIPIDMGFELLMSAGLLKIDG